MCCVSWYSSSRNFGISVATIANTPTFSSYVALLARVFRARQEDPLTRIWLLGFTNVQYLGSGPQLLFRHLPVPWRRYCSRLGQASMEEWGRLSQCIEISTTAWFCIKLVDFSVKRSGASAVKRFKQSNAGNLNQEIIRDSSGHLLLFAWKPRPTIFSALFDCKPSMLLA